MHLYMRLCLVFFKSPPFRREDPALQIDFMSKLHCNLDMKYIRQISSTIQKSKSSILLLGPRQTGKSTLIQSLKPDLTINLANERIFLSYSSRPDLLEQILIQEKPKSVFIDEIQRLPSLLNTIQAIIDEKKFKIKFYLTGSSARKLKRGSANLLPGRVISLQMCPLSLEEVNFDYNLDQVLSFGLMPGIFTEKNIKEKSLILNTYGATYLKEEVQAEALTKNIEGFSRFLFAIAAKNGEFLDFTKLASQAMINQKTASRFFEILEDSLIVFRLNSYSKSSFRRLVQHPKFFFFDTGVLNSLLGSYKISSDRKGMIFENFIVASIRNLLLSKAIFFQMSSYRTTSGSEVDLILNIEDLEFAIEIKASNNVGKSDLTGLNSFSEISKGKPIKLIIYTGEHARKMDDISILPVNQAMQFIGSFC